MSEVIRSKIMKSVGRKDMGKNSLVYYFYKDSLNKSTFYKFLIKSIETLTVHSEK